MEDERRDRGAEGPPCRGWLLFAGCFLVAFLPRFLLPDRSPLYHDVAGMLHTVRASLEEGAEIPFGEIWLYRPLLPVMTLAVEKLVPGPVTPEGLFRSLTLLTQVCYGLTAALLGLWLHRRGRFRPLLVLAAILCLTCMPVVLLFSASGLSLFPALLFGTAAFLAADLSLHATRPRDRILLALAVGLLLQLAVLTRETMALLAPACALLYLSRRRWGLLVLSFGGGFLALSAWLALEAAVFHPDHSLTELLPLSGFAGGGGAGALFAGRNWLRLLENVAVALGWGVAPLALAGLFLGRRSPLPLGPLLAWVLFLLLLQVQFPQTAIRFRVAYSIPVLLLCLRALPAGRRPGVSALVMGLLALVGFFSALPALRTFVTLPHAFHLRAERMDRHAGNKDVLLFIGPDTAYGNWLLHGRRIVLSLKDLLDRETLADLIERRDHAAVVETGRIAPLLERFLVPAVRAAAAQDRDFFVVPYPGQLPAFTGLREKGLTVEVVEELPPGRSHSQFDPFGWRISPQQGPSQRKEHLLRLSAR